MALTKADLVDDELLELARADVERFLAATPFATRRSSSSALATAAACRSCSTPWRRVPARSRPVVARGRPACRSTASFALRGFGTVVTGTLWRGAVGAGDRLVVQPAARR